MDQLSRIIGILRFSSVSIFADGRISSLSYEDLVCDRYVEPSNEKIIGTFISLASQPPNNSDRMPKKNSVVNTQKSAGKKKKNGSPSKKKEPSTKKSRDIRDMLKRYEKGPVPKHIPTPSTIIIDSD